MNYRLNLFIFLLPFSIFTQTGPGGVGNTSDNPLWLKANVGTTSNVNSSPVVDWFDQSGNGNDVWQTNNPQQPLYMENVMNGMGILPFYLTIIFLVDRMIFFREQAAIH